jgi:hypothetical protein
MPLLDAEKPPAVAGTKSVSSFEPKYGPRILVVLMFLITLGHFEFILRTTPKAMSGECGTCLWLARGELRQEIIAVECFCLFAWLAAWNTGSVFATRIARGGALACAVASIVSQGFVLRWW